MAVQIRVDVRGIRDVQQAFERLSKAGRKLRRPLQQAALFVKRAAQRRLRARKLRWGPTRGILARSLTTRVDDKGFEVGSNLRYAAVQQVGGDILPKTVKSLAIPMLAHLRRGGIWPRDLPKGSLKFVPINKGHVVGKLVRAELTDPGADGAKPGAKRGAGRPKQKLGETMYLLLDKVTIPARPYLVWDNEAKDFLLRALDAEYRRAAGGRL